MLVIRKREKGKLKSDETEEYLFHGQHRRLVLRLNRHARIEHYKLMSGYNTLDSRHCGEKLGTKLDHKII